MSQGQSKEKVAWVGQGSHFSRGLHGLRREFSQCPGAPALYWLYVPTLPTCVVPTSVPMEEQLVPLN